MDFISKAAFLPSSPSNPKVSIGLKIYHNNVSTWSKENQTLLTVTNIDQDFHCHLDNIGTFNDLPTKQNIISHWMCRCKNERLLRRYQMTGKNIRMNRTEDALGSSLQVSWFWRRKWRVAWHQGQIVRMSFCLLEFFGPFPMKSCLRMR